MTCPVCSAHNAAMNVRCFECSTVLIPEAVGRSADVRRTVDNLDRRLYTGYGGLAGFVIGLGSWFVLSRDETDVKPWLVFFVILGTALGKLIAWRMRTRP